MELLLHIGLDWSGRPSLSSRRPDIFIACFAGVGNVEELAIRFDALRLRVHGESSAELHGYKMLPESIAEALTIGLNLKMRVGALCIDKTASVRNGTLPDSHHLHAEAALRLWEQFVAKNQVARLSYDTELEGKERQKRFETEIKRRSAAFYPAQKIKVKPLHSHKSDLIQLADVVAYALGRQLRNEKVDASIVELLTEIRRQNDAVGHSAEIW